MTRIAAAAMPSVVHTDTMLINLLGVTLSSNVPVAANFGDSSHNTTPQAHLDASGVVGGVGQEFSNDASRELAGALVLLLHDPHALPNVNRGTATV